MKHFSDQLKRRHLFQDFCCFVLEICSTLRRTAHGHFLGKAGTKRLPNVVTWRDSVKVHVVEHLCFAVSNISADGEFHARWIFMSFPCLYSEHSILPHSEVNMLSCFVTVRTFVVNLFPPANRMVWTYHHSAPNGPCGKLRTSAGFTFLFLFWLVSQCVIPKKINT